MGVISRQIVSFSWLLLSPSPYLSQGNGDGNGAVYHFDGALLCGHGFHSAHQLSALPWPEELARRVVWPDPLFLGEREMGAP